MRSVPCQMTATDKYEATHPAFLRSLKKSQDAVWQVARYLNDKGYPVRLPKVELSPTRSESEEYSDHGDIEMGVRIEVKHLSCHFTCAKDWPFPESCGFMVCSTSSYDKADPKPWRYYYLNKARTHAAVLLPKDTFQFWRREWRVVRNHGPEPQQLYICDKEVPTFFRFPEE